MWPSTSRAKPASVGSGPLALSVPPNHGACSFKRPANALSVVSTHSTRVALKALIRAGASDRLKRVENTPSDRVGTRPW